MHTWLILTLSRYCCCAVGHGKEGQVCSPTSVAVDRDGLVYVADTGNHRIQVYRHDTVSHTYSLLTRYIFIRMYTYTVCMYMYTYSSVSPWYCVTHLIVALQAYGYMYVRICCVCIYVYFQVCRPDTVSHTFSLLTRCIYIRMYICVYALHVHMYCVGMYIYIYIYIYIYRHLYIYIHK